VINEDRLLNVVEAAKRLGVSASYLNKLRIKGGSPPYLKIGARILYEPADLSAWLASRKRRSTSDAGEAAK
jgi:excisionase family DNA binding protein